MQGSRTERLRQAVAEAQDERGRLAAWVALARHFAEVSDGVNGLDAARQARELALRLQDWSAAAHALNSASISQYHRSDYAGALATAIDAWDSARRGGKPLDLAESLYTIALALHSLGELDGGLRIVERAIEMTAGDAALREPHVRLVGLKALYFHQLGRHDDMEAFCARAVALARDASPRLLELGHGNWALALLRSGEQRMDRGESAGDLLDRSREHFEAALRIAESEGDAQRTADRLSGLGQVAFVQGRHEEAGSLLADALRRSLELDYVRTAVMSARYLARLRLAQGDDAGAIEVLRLADDRARRGAPADSRPVVKLMLAGALDASGQHLEAERLRAAAFELRSADEAHRSVAAAQARKLAQRVLAEISE